MVFTNYGVSLLLKIIYVHIIIVYLFIRINSDFIVPPKLYTPKKPSKWPAIKLPTLKWHPWKNVALKNTINRALLHRQKTIATHVKRSRINLSIPLASIVYANLNPTHEWTQTDVDKILEIGKSLMVNHKYDAADKFIYTFYIDLIKVTTLEYQDSHELKTDSTELLQPIIDDILRKFNGCRVSCGQDHYGLWTASDNDDRIFIFGVTRSCDEIIFVCVQKDRAAEIISKLTDKTAEENQKWHIGSVNILECQNLTGCPKMDKVGRNKAAAIEQQLCFPTIGTSYEVVETDADSSSIPMIDCGHTEMAPYLDYVGQSHFEQVNTSLSMLRGITFVDHVSRRLPIY